MLVKELLALREAKKKYTSAPTPLKQLQALPQPIGINGGSYTYWVDVTKTPLEFVASDGSELGDECRTLEDISKWMEKWTAEIWKEFLDGEESLDFLREEGIVRLKKGRTDQRDHETTRT